MVKLVDQWLVGQYVWAIPYEGIGHYEVEQRLRIDRFPPWQMPMVCHHSGTYLPKKAGWGDRMLMLVTHPWKFLQEEMEVWVVACLFFSTEDVSFH